VRNVSRQRASARAHVRDIEQALDDDRPAAGEAPTETFAQRKARMEAEAAAKANGDAAKPAPEPAGPAKPEPAPEPSKPTAASLYGLDASAPSTDGEGEEA
jgi:sec-independent protein translocase protein TatB